MAKLVYGLSQSLDGYVDHEKFAPGPLLFRHFIEHVRGLAGSLYGRRTYEILRYWDEDQSDWSADDRDFADGMAAPAEVDCFTHAELGRPQRRARRQ